MAHVGKTWAFLVIMALFGTLTSCQSETGATGSSSRSTDTSSPPATTSPAPSTAPITSGAPSTTVAAPVLGPDGFGSLKLGMDRATAEATGEVQPFRNEPLGDRCLWRTWLKGAPTSEGNEGMVLYSETFGVATIAAYPGVRTPAGITIGSSLADVQKAYPGFQQSIGERGYVPVPGNNQLVYRISLNGGTVGELSLQYAGQDCYE